MLPGSWYDALFALSALGLVVLATLGLAAAFGLVVATALVVGFLDAADVLVEVLFTEPIGAAITFAAPGVGDVVHCH